MQKEPHRCDSFSFVFPLAQLSYINIIARENRTSLQRLSIVVPTLLRRNSDIFSSRQICPRKLEYDMQTEIVFVANKIKINEDDRDQYRCPDAV